MTSGVILSPSPTLYQHLFTVDNHVILTQGQGSWVNPTSAIFLFKEILWGGL
jgi:hypothetical protein